MAILRYQTPQPCNSTRLAHTTIPNLTATALVCAWQLSEAVLLQTANEMFPEGQGKPRTVTKDGGAAPLINALLINAKAAVGMHACALAVRSGCRSLTRCVSAGSSIFASGALLPSPHIMGRRGAAVESPRKGAQPPPGLELMPFPPYPVRSHGVEHPCVATGTSM